MATLAGHTGEVTACAVTPDGRHVISASYDGTLKVWELGSASATVTLEGHSAWVTACAVTPDGRHVLSASKDQTLKVWDLATSTCRITHRGDAPYSAVVATASALIAGDESGAISFLDLPPSMTSPDPQARLPVVARLQVVLDDVGIVDVIREHASVRLVYA